MRYLTFCLLLTLACLASAARGADGELDLGFGSDADFRGYSFVSNLDSNPFTANTLIKTLPGADGKTYLVGVMTDAQNNPRLSIVRIPATGQIGDENQGYFFKHYPLPPCTGDKLPSDAATDGLGRLWVAFPRCNDARIYRFTPEGEPDFDLLGTGYLTADFALSELTSSQLKIASTPGNGIIAVAAVNYNGNDFGLSALQFTADGDPMVDEFGSGVPALFTPEGLLKTIHGVHLMDNGRIVINGRLPGGVDANVFVVRLLPNGDLDGNFGNAGPGYSEAAFNQLLLLNGNSVSINGSVLLRDGSLVQTGWRRVAGNNRDFMIVKWRPDGFLDESVGPHGHRVYALDFGGPFPDKEEWNYDVAHRLVRQGNGKLVLVGQAWVGNGPPFSLGISLLRLNRDFSIDTQFGDGGKIRHWLPVSAGGQTPGYTELTPVDVRLEPGRILIGAGLYSYNAHLNLGFYQQTAIALRNDLLFADTFD